MLIDPTLWRQLQDVNRKVNALPYRTDAALYDRPDFWAVIGGEGGDCEDYALGKRARLMGLGWPYDLLDLATCWTEHDERHAVLIVTTTAGEYVLDNRFTDPMPWVDLPYRWDRRQMHGGPGWVAISV